MFGVKSGRINIRDTYMDFAVFGKGEKNLVMLPGLSARGIKGSETMLRFMYRIFSKEYTVYIFDRLHTVPEGYSVRDMAEDTVRAMKEMKIEKAAVFGVSQGGMIAQSIAANYPGMTEKLVLGVTISRQNATLSEAVNRWIGYAEKGDYISLNKDVFTSMYSEKYLRKNKLLIPIAARLAKPENLQKFIILAKACLTFDGYDDLDRIKCPVLVLGGRKDKVTTGEASEEIAKKLGCDIYMYDEYGHAAYDEANDFNQRIYNFLEK